MKRRFLEGASGPVGETKEAGLPNIKGTASASGHTQLSVASATGAFYALNQGGQYRASYYYVTNGLGFDASRSNAIYGNSETVQPASYTVNYLIKAY